MRFEIVTIFPEMFDSPFSHGIIKRALKSGLIELVLHQLRDFSQDAYTVDDRPYGGGAGMILKPEPLAKAVKSIHRLEKSLVILLTPQGELLNQKMALELSRLEQLILICGRYEGVDERFRQLYVEKEISIGDYVLSGGELPAMVLIDVVARQIPGVLGNEESAKSESFTDGLLEHPHYTRPYKFEGLKVPDVLLSGNHKDIEEWKKKKSVERTRERRKDLLKNTCK